MSSQGVTTLSPSSPVQASSSPRPGAGTSLTHSPHTCTFSQDSSVSCVTFGQAPPEPKVPTSANSSSFESTFSLDCKVT